MKIKYSDTLFIILTGFLTILICSKSSPLYPTNDWVDANCYMTVGRAMTEGKMPYRDLFEHKGPLLYIIHAVGAMISDSSFFGIFIFETAACICFLQSSYRLLQRITGNHSLWAIPFLAMVVYSSQAFCHGDSAEEFCLPLILCFFILGLDAVENRKVLSGKNSFLMGVFVGIVFWIKFNLLGFYIGAFLVIVVLSRKNGIASLLRMCGFIILGVGAVSLPLILFFAAKNSLYSLFEVYFYNNIFVYGGEKTSLLRNLTNGGVFSLRFLPIGSALIFSGIAAAVFSGKRKYALYGIASMLTAFLGTFAGHLSYRYYPLILAPFAVIFGVAVILAMDKKVRRIKRYMAPVSLILCMAAAFILSPNTYLMRYKKDRLPQYRFAKLINETENPSLLNYGFLDGGFYLAAGIIPDQRYFCCNNMKLSAMTESQERCVQAGIPDYIVTRSASEEHPEFPLYTCIAEDEFIYYDKTLHYFLFRRDERIP